tara:strand:+ start:327 stop:578 length:252 start_codon:yes stop_codon:yes gene_type:complete
MKSSLLASVNLGLPSPQTQSWPLWDYPENPYIVLQEYKAGDVLHEIRRHVDTDKIQKDPFDRQGHYLYSGIIEAHPFQDVEVG